MNYLQNYLKLNDLKTCLYKFFSEKNTHQSRLYTSLYIYFYLIFKKGLGECLKYMSITNVGFSCFLQENSKKLKMKFPPKIPNRKTKSKTNKGGITQPNINDSLEITKLDSSIISEGKISTITPQIQAFNLQKAAAGLF